MKKIFSFVAVFFAVTALTSLNLYAAKDSKPKEKAPFHLGKFQDNWMVSAGAGVNVILDNGSFGVPQVAVTASFGKWLTPHWGLRAGYQGFSNQATDTANGWFAGSDKFGFHYIHGDVLFNILGVNPKRIVSPFVYVHAGNITTVWNGVSNGELGAGLGLMLNVKIVGGLEASVDLRVTGAREETWRNAGTIILFPALTGGLTYNFGFGRNGKVGFDRHQKEVVTKTVEVASDCNHAAQLAALKAEVDSLNALKAKVQTIEKPVVEGWVTYFLLDKSDLTEREKYHLMDFLSVLPQGATLTIVGHADKETGNPRHNAKLAERRVDTVYRALKELGFQGVVNTDAKGDTQNPFANPYPKNRCVTIQVNIQ